MFVGGKDTKQGKPDTGTRNVKPGTVNPVSNVKPGVPKPAPTAPLPKK